LDEVIGRKGLWIYDIVLLLYPFLPTSANNISKQLKRGGGLHFKDAVLIVKHEANIAFRPVKQEGQVGKGAFPAFGTTDDDDARLYKRAKNNTNDGNGTKRPRRKNNAKNDNDNTSDEDKGK
jgi:hypothetical protein